jgi:TRAP-type mannitol/chloroaromatic compound transport system substrate-binding protein
MTVLTRRRLAGSLVAGSAIAAPAVLRAETPHHWTMVTSWPRDLPGPGVTARRLADRINTMSAGRVVVDVKGAGELVPAFEVMDAVGSGTADLAHTAAVFWAGKARASQFFLAVPFGLTPLEHIAWIEHGGGQALWDELYAPFGVKPFMAGNTGMSMGGWFKRELHGAADFEGLKFAMPGLGGEMYKPFGIIQVSIPVGERLPALQSGAIDAVEFAGPFSDLALGFFRAAPFYYGPGLHEPNGTGECIVSRRLWEGLPPDLKAVVENACRAENAYALAESERMNAAALTSLVSEHGVKLRQFPHDIQARARASAAAVLASFAEAGGLDARIHDSYAAMQVALRDWSAVSAQSFLAARNEA